MQECLFEELPKTERQGFSQGDILSTFLNLQEEHPDKEITRDFFVKTTNIPKADIVYHFGSYTALKVLAGANPSTSEKKLQKLKSQELFKEEWRQGGDVRFLWNNTFPGKTNSNHRFLRFVSFCDVHDEMCDPFYRRMGLQAIRDTKADKVVFNGDLFDLAEASKYNTKLSEYNPRRKMEWVHNFFSDIRDEVPDAEIVLVEGNHEYRLVSHLTEKAPYIMDVLNYRGFGVREFLGLDKFNVNYYARSDLGAYTTKDIKDALMRNYYKFEDKVLFHHFPTGMKFGMPGVNGHHHRYFTKPLSNATYGNYNWIQSGGGVRRYADYLVSMGELWDNGFVIVTIDTLNKHNTILEYVDTSREFCRLHGFLYERTEEEKKYLVQ